jgi:hypothetical protein
MSICIYMNPLLNRCGINIHILLGFCNLDAGRGWNSLLDQLSSLLILAARLKLRWLSTFFSFVERLTTF